MTESIAAKDKISGCLFAVLGSIIIAFGIFLINRGSSSRRWSMLEDYALDVSDWANGGKERFNSLEISYQSVNESFVPIDKIEAQQKFAEFDVLAALGQLTDEEAFAIQRTNYAHNLKVKHMKHFINDDDFRDYSNVDASPSGERRLTPKRNLDHAVITKEILDATPLDQWDVKYTPLKYETTFSNSTD